MGEFINQHFLSLRIYGKSEIGKQFREKYPVSGYPTVILIKSDGTEYERFFGYDGDAEAWFQTLQDYAAGKNLLSTLLAEVNAQPEDLELNYKVAQKYVDRWEIENAKPFLEKTLALDPQDTKGHGEQCRMNLAIYEARIQKNVTPLREFLVNAKQEKFLEIGYSNLTRFYSRTEQDSIQLLQAYDEAVQKLPNNTQFLNGYAWHIYEKRISSKYTQGIEMALRAVELAPKDASIWDTLAWLLYENGDLKKATEAMQKAVELEPETKYFKENLEKFQKEFAAKAAV